MFEALKVEPNAETLESAMTAHELSRLISSYSWLSQELAEQTKAGSEHNCAHIRSEMDMLFLKIVQFPADDAHICCAQIDFLVTAMGEQGADAKARAALCDITLSHLRRLVTMVGEARSRQRPGKPQKGRSAGATGGRPSFRTGSA